MDIKTTVPVIGRGNTIDEFYTKVYTPFLRQLDQVLSSFERRIAELEKSSKTITVNVQLPDEIKINMNSCVPGPAGLGDAKGKTE